MSAGPFVLLLPIVSLAVAALGRASPTAPAVPPRVIEAYQLFAKRECGVHALRLAVDASEASAEREPLRLVDAYCLELEGASAAAKDLYASIAPPIRGRLRPRPGID